MTDTTTTTPSLTTEQPLPPPSFEQRKATLEAQGVPIVSPGEVCTIERLKDYGLFDNNRYVKDDAGMDDLKTFNIEKDEKESRLRSICKMDLDGTKAYPHCIDQYGPGFKRKPGYPEVCITHDCPPGFAREGMFCKKEPVLKDARIDKRSRCDERWHDWFTIPNYHLGNKFDNNGKVGQCFSPCPQNHVPAMVTDPVDNAKLTWFGEDHKDKCIPRDVYFAGKYAGGTDYCPLAWIYRTGMTPAKIKEKLQAKRDALRNMSEGFTTIAFDKNASDSEIAKQVDTISKDVNTLLTNIDRPSDTMEIACIGLNTPERLRDAYAMCQELEKSEEAMILDTDPTRDAKKKAMMKQACNAVFCSENNDAISVIAKEPICFPTPPVVQMEEQKAGDAIPEAQQQAMDRETFFKKSVRTAFFFMIFLPLSVLLIWIFYKAMKYVWPVVKSVLRKIRSILTGKMGLRGQYEDTMSRLNEAEFMKAKRMEARIR